MRYIHILLEGMSGLYVYFHDNNDLLHGIGMMALFRRIYDAPIPGFVVLGAL